MEDSVSAPGLPITANFFRAHRHTFDGIIWKRQLQSKLINA